MDSRSLGCPPSVEHVQGHQRGHQRARVVHDLRHPQLDGRAHQHVRGLACEAVLGVQPVEHLDQRSPRCHVEIHVGEAPVIVHRYPGGREVRAARARRRLPAGDGRLPAVASQADAHGRRAAGLDRRDADLAVALGEVQVADREHRARHVHGKEQPAAGLQVADVHVAAVLARREGAQAVAGGRRRGALGVRQRHPGAGRSERGFALQCPREQLARRGHADHAGEHSGRHRHARQLVRACDPLLDPPLHQERIREQVAEECPSPARSRSSRCRRSRSRGSRPPARRPARRPAPRPAR